MVGQEILKNRQKGATSGEKFRKSPMPAA